MAVVGGLVCAAGAIIGLICSIIIIIDAFKNEVWKGLLYLFCAPYALYYMFAEFQHEKKVQIILGAILAPLAGWGIFFVTAMMSGSH
jgi:hypothetical protein